MASASIASQARRRDEIQRGVTLVGPQRDDIELGIGALPAKGYASHGESWSVARALRLDPSLAMIPIIAVTSYAMPGDRERCLAAGCNGYIEKPIDPGSFAAEVERFVPEAP